MFRFPIFVSHFCIGEHRTAFGAREGHVEQAPLLFETLGRLGGPLRREEGLLHPDDVDVFELQPLGRMDGHERHFVVIARVLLLVHVGGERHTLQPLLDGSLPELHARADLGVADLGVALLLEELHRVEQLIYVAERRSSLGAVLTAVERQNARTRRHLHTEVVESLLCTFERQRADERHELGDLAHDRALHGIAHRLGHQRVDRLPHRHAPFGRQPGDTQHGGVADAARRIVDDASEGLVVARVDHQPDIGQHILDLLAVVECGPFINSIRNSSSE